MRTEVVWMTIIFLCLFGFVSGFGHNIIIVTPSNKAVFVGQRMEMECSVGNGSIVRTWSYVPTSGESPVNIVTNTKTGIQIATNLSRFGVNIDSGSGMLYLNSTKMEDAGIYTCEAEMGSTSAKSNAYLIVLESAPICETNVTENVSLDDASYVWMKCTVNFRGNWMPTMEWRQHCVQDENSEEESLVTEGIETTVMKYSRITSMLTLINPCTKKVFYYSCKIYFTRHNDSVKTNATNIPNYNYTWRSPKIAVTSYTTKGTDISLEGPTSGDVLFLLMGIVICLGFFLLVLLIVIVCCVIARRKAAEWMANFVSTYRKVETRPSNDSQRTMTETLSNEDVTSFSVQDDFPLGKTFTLQGYTSVDDLAEECNLAIENQSTVSKLSTYTAVTKSKPEEATARSAATYSIVHDDPLLYDTLRKDTDPPKYDYSNEDSDSDD